MHFPIVSVSVFLRTVLAWECIRVYEDLKIVYNVYKSCFNRNRRREILQFEIFYHMGKFYLGFALLDAAGAFKVQF